MGYWLKWNWYASSRSEVTTTGWLILTSCACVGVTYVSLFHAQPVKLGCGQVLIISASERAFLRTRKGSGLKERESARGLQGV